MSMEERLTHPAGSTTDPKADPAVVLRWVPHTVLAAVVVAAGYFLGSLLGLSLRFPETGVSAFWPPNAILLAALLVTPRRRWWTYLAAVLPAHLLAQALKGIPFTVVLINYAGNAGDALLGAVLIQRFLGESQRFDRLRAMVLIVFFGGILAPALMSFVVAELFVWIGRNADPWVAWRLRLLTNTLAVCTLVPPLVLALTKARLPGGRAAPHRRAEASAMLTGLLVVGILVFELPRAGAGESPLLLYAPLPFLFWAATRFGLAETCLSMLTLGALAMWGIFHGRGPFVAHAPVENATSLVLFLNVVFVPLLMLAALMMERKSVDEGHRQVETLHSAVLASVHDQIAVLDRDGTILEVNESWSGAGREGPGTNYLDLCRREAQRYGESEARMLVGLEAVLSRARERFQMELACRVSRQWHEISAEGLMRPEGGAVITYADVTSRKSAELEAREQRQELAHLTRVAMLGELSGALAHELNQPLTAILSNAQAAQRMLAREPIDLIEVGEILRDIAEDDRRAGEVIQRLRAMLRKDEAKLLPLGVNELVAEVLSFAHSDLITRNVSVTTELAAELPPVYGDRVQLQQVLLNLVLNACEAMSARQREERRLTLVAVRDGEAGVRVSVIDRGTGIPADELERVFTPFFTTKEHGLGLGLSICRSIVAAHGGRLWASNNEECGATFHLTLPLPAAAPE